MGGQFSVVDPFWLVFFRWGARQGYEMRKLYPAYARYAESLCERPSVKRALDVEGISIWS